MFVWQIQLESNDWSGVVVPTVSDNVPVQGSKNLPSSTFTKARVLVLYLNGL